MTTEELKVVISAETSKIKAPMKEVNKALNNIKEASKEASSSIDSLTDKCSDQSKELRDLKRQYVDVAAAQGENSDEAQALAKQIEKLSGEYLNNGKRMEELANKADSFDKVSQAMKKAAEEQKRFSEAQKKAAEAQKKAAKEAAEAQKQFSSDIQKIGDIAKKGLAVAAKAIAGAATALVGLTAATKGYREGQAKLVTTFETAGASANVAKQTYNDLYRVLGEDDTAVEAANHLAQLTTNQAELSEWTNICQGVYATFGSSLPIESLTEAANETAKVGTVTGSLADALNWAGISEDAFNEKLAACNTEAEREALIRSTLNGVYAGAAENYEKNAEGVLKQNEAQIKLNENLAKIGETMAPINAALTTFISEILAKIAPDIEKFINEHGPDIEATLTRIADAIGSVLTWISENWVFVSSLAVVIGAISVALSVFASVMTIVNAVTLASPVTWIVLAIVAALAALVAIIVIVIMHWDKIKATVGKVVEAIKTFVSDMVEKVKGKITSLVDKIKEKFSNVKETLSKPFEKAKEVIKGIVDKIKGFFSFKIEFPKIKLPHFGIKPKGWKVGDLLEGSIPKLSIDWYAKGGVFENPTAFGMNGNKVMVGGEDGAEAIVPLEKNTEWLDKIADKLAAKQGATPIVLNVDGKTFAQTSVNSINQLTKQTGSLGLKLF